MDFLFKKRKFIFETVDDIYRQTSGLGFGLAMSSKVKSIFANLLVTNKKSLTNSMICGRLSGKIVFDSLVLLTIIQMDNNAPKFFDETEYVDNYIIQLKHYRKK